MSHWLHAWSRTYKWLHFICMKDMDRMSPLLAICEAIFQEFVGTLSKVRFIWKAIIFLCKYFFNVFQLEWHHMNIKWLASWLFVVHGVEANIADIINVFHITVPLHGETTAHQWIPLTKRQLCGKRFHIIRRGHPPLTGPLCGEAASWIYPHNRACNVEKCLMGFFSLWLCS